MRNTKAKRKGDCSPQDLFRRSEHAAAAVDAPVHDEGGRGYVQRTQDRCFNEVGN